MWRLALTIHRRFDTPIVLRRAGPLILFGLIAMWLTLLILGWALVFGHREQLVSVDGGDPVAFLGRVYFAAATIIGRGSDVSQPNSDLAQALVEVAGATGVMLLSLGIAYVLPVVQGVVDKRETARYVFTLGDDPADVLRRAWDGGSLGDLNLHLIALTPRVIGVTQRHLAYPIIHYFHSGDLRSAMAPAIVTLDEVVTLNDLIEPEYRMPTTATEPLRAALSGFLSTLEHDFIDSTDFEATPPDLDELEATGIPLVEDRHEQELAEETIERRRLLRGYIEHDGWGGKGRLPPADRRDPER